MRQQRTATRLNSNASSNDQSGRQLVRTIQHGRGLRKATARAQAIASMRDPRLFTPKQLDKLGIVHPRSKDEGVLEAFREIRTMLFSLRANRNCVLMVSSVAPAGGASFTALNLCSAIAFDETRTSLLIDCNLKKPSMHQLLRLAKLDNGYGLTDYLDNEGIGIESIVRPSGIPRMRIVPAGEKANTPQEYFTAPNMKRFLNDVKRRYADRYIVLDAPCITQSTDARILAGLCDYVLLVAPYGEVVENQVAQAVSIVGQDKLAGVVLNGEPPMNF